ncbi:hypothetical protein [Pseudomonas oryzicola]|uniref:Lipoprotein n=1 Tax=Pseudomonas oryzicola TaxID=485876 RepID=A0ABS6QB75_9PSED|nr:hypothetical protein [Pseudomonas oryzicola]MBV4491414.1 hypothetical protein [Pseudomonas oryzicola]
MKHVMMVLCVVSLTGCCQQVTKPSEITLVQAMEQVGQGINAMRAAQGDAKTGLFAESASVTFNISADTTASGGLKVDLAPPVVSDGVGIHADTSASQNSKRSNSITITYKNILALPKDSVGQSLAGVASSDGNRTKLEELIDRLGVQIQNVRPAPPNM